MNDSKIVIAVLQRGWVYVGRLTMVPDMPGWLRLKGANCIRSWGTTNGLGQLRKGPTAITKLDPAGTVDFHELTAVNLIRDLEEAAWAKHCD